MNDKGQFSPIESESDMNEGIFLELIEEEDNWKYFFITGASLISKRAMFR